MADRKGDDMMEFDVCPICGGTPRHMHDASINGLVECVNKECVMFDIPMEPSAWQSLPRRDEIIDECKSVLWVAAGELAASGLYERAIEGQDLTAYRARVFRDAAALLDRRKSGKETI